MNREVNYLKMHQVPFIPGVGGLSKNTFDPREQLGIKMFATAAGVECTFKHANFIVPWGNIAIACFAPEPPKPAKTAA